jgi:protein-S-isoprenylcysteine O-methyltransferase Ste14
MPTEALTMNRIVVLGSAVVYWSTVCIQARRVRRHIGRSPNVRPHGLKEQLLWFGWFFVVISWMALPWLARSGAGPAWARIISSFGYPLNVALGTVMMIAGYAFTLWCYVAMGDAWRMGVNRSEPTQLVTNGPYRLMRHPIYSAQVLMVSAMVVLLPCALSLITFAIHVLCVMIKAADEEAHLRTQLGQAYEEYRARTRWFRRFPGRKPSVTRSSELERKSLKPIGHRVR